MQIVSVKSSAKAQFMRNALEQRMNVDVYLQTAFVDRAVCQLPEAIRSAPVARLQLQQSVAIGETTCAAPMSFGGARTRVVFPWSACHFLIRADQQHCIDWALIPEGQVEGFERFELMADYKRLNAGASWLFDLSIGGPIDWTARPKVNTRKLPNGWRLIEGGRT